jgi:hypothetical protein
LDAHPALYEAYSIYTANEDPTETRWELEARLLANETFDSISTKMGIDSDTIRWYEKVFFDVLDRLSSPSLIIHTIIGRAVQAGLAEREYDCLWKLFGYSLGPSVLDALVYKFNNPRHTDSPDQLRSAMRDLTKDTVDIKAAITIMGMPVSWQTRELIMTLWKDMIQMELTAGQAGIGTETLTQNIHAMTTSFEHLFVKRIPDKEIDRGQITTLEATGARLRATELMAAGVGEKLEGLEYLLSTAKYPEQDENDNS